MHAIILATALFAQCTGNSCTLPTEAEQGLSRRHPVARAVLITTALPARAVAAHFHRAAERRQARRFD